MAVAVTQWTDVVTALAACVASVGTVAAVIVALFGQPWLDRRRKPQLSLELGRSTLGHGWAVATAPAEPVTLRVRAKPGRRTARDVEVLLTASWTTKRTGPHNVPHTVLDHFPLTWYRAAGRRDAVTRVDLAPGSSQEVELLRIGKPAALYHYLGWAQPGDAAGELVIPSNPDDEEEEQEIAFFEVAAFPLRDTDEDVLGSSVFLQSHLVFELRLLVTATDVDSVAYKTKLQVGVSWDPDEPTSFAETFEKDLEVHLQWSPLERA